MARYVASAAFRAMVTMFVVSVIVFVLVRLSGDVVEFMVSPEATAEDIAAVRAYLGLDQTWPEQYWKFISRAVTGDFGKSVVYGRPAAEVVLERYPATLKLTGLSFCLALLIAIPIGVYSAVKRDSWFDYAGRVFAALGQATPSFWLGLILILLFGVYLGWLPTSGSETWAHTLLPAATLGWYASVGIMRLTRSSMIDVLGNEYVKLARMKGLPEHMVIWKHAFKNAALPVMTIAGVLLLIMINASVVVETVFSWPGVGLLTIEAVFSRDYPLVQTSVIFLSALFVLSNLIVDILYGWLNPKIKTAA